MVIALEGSLVSTSGTKLCRLDLESGEILESLPLGEAGVFPLYNSLAFVGPYRQKWRLIYLNDFSVIESFSQKQLHPTATQLYIEKAELHDGKLILTQYEKMVDADSVTLTVDISQST
jgi:hypothetical protein